jgi:hypothetical protein
MSRFATASSKRQRGQSIVAVIGVTAVMGVLVATALGVALHSNNGSARDARGDAALQAADAGVDTYLARLVADPRYWDHYVDEAEDPRYASTNTTCTGSALKQPGASWTSGTTWKYCGTSSTWIQIQSANYGPVSYSLRVTPPAGTSDIVTIQATGRAGVAGAKSTVTRSVQAQVRPSSVADFQAISNVGISYGTTATTDGKIYSNQYVIHNGTDLPTSPIFAPTVSPHSSSLQGGYFDSTTNPSFADKFPTPISFSTFQSSLTTIRDAAISQSLYFDDSSLDGWLVQFVSGGTVNIWKITNTSNGLGRDFTLNCTKQTKSITSYTLMYFNQPVVVGTGSNPCDAQRRPLDSVVDGRVTIATPGDLYVGGNISYAASGDDVLGLIAGDDLIIGTYAPDTMTWRAATLAQTGQWVTATGDGSHSSMTFTGTQAMRDGGSAAMFDTRTYRYDSTQLYLRPPLFPTLGGSWVTQYWHEVTPP